MLASPGLLNFAVEAGLYDPGSGRPFNFFAAFMRDGPHDVNYSYPRVCLLQRLFGACPPAANCANMLAQPTFMRPTPHKLGVRVGGRAGVGLMQGWWGVWGAWAELPGVLGPCAWWSCLPPVRCRLGRMGSGRWHVPACHQLRPAHPPRTAAVQDVKAAMRNHWDGSAHDPYLHGNPDEPWRPIALLRTSMGHGEAAAGKLAVPLPWLGRAGTHGLKAPSLSICRWPSTCPPRALLVPHPRPAVTQVRPAAAGLPDALSIITHVTFATPKLAPFIPLYKGLPGDAVPRELTVARAGQPDAVSLFWRARRLQALVFQVGRGAGLGGWAWGVERVAAQPMMPGGCLTPTLPAIGHGPVGMQRSAGYKRLAGRPAGCAAAGLGRAGAARGRRHCAV